MLDSQHPLSRSNGTLMKRKLSFGIGKYRDLLLAIALFIVLDLGILLFNFVASSQLERDAGRINAAGELRMLTQQLTKAVLTLQAERTAGMPTQTSLAQLAQGHAGFERALDSLRASTLEGTEWAFGIDAALLVEAVAAVEKEWRPLAVTLQPLLAGAEPAMQDIEIAVNKAVARNLRLMSLCDDLAHDFEAAARTKANRMRQIQVLAIGLALLNFVYIVFKFLRRLNASDRLAEAARRETEDILNTVGEGLLLVRADGTLGGQFSASVPRLLLRKVRPGDRFAALLDDLLEPARAAEARHFLQLMFDPKVKPALLVQLDPLQEVAIRIPKGSREAARYLTFRMTQVREGDKVKELLVTVFDATRKVQLERELALTQEAARGDVEDLIRVLEHEPALLQDFLDSVRARLAGLNRLLRDASSSTDYRQRLGEAATLVHGVKGEAAALWLGALSRQAHVTEDVLAPLLRQERLRGDDLIPVAVELSRVQEQVERIARVFGRVAQLAPGRAGRASLADAMVDSLKSLSERVAQEVNKQVRLTARIDQVELPPPVTRVLREALPQLVRNAVVHGIEPPVERIGQGKPAVGELHLEVGRGVDGDIEVSLRDDGRGIEVPLLRQQAARLRSDAAQLSDAQVLGLIFDSQFTTAGEVTEHAGRGVGLALVRQLAEQAGARLRVVTQPRSYTRFVMNFASAA